MEWWKEYLQKLLRVEQEAVKQKMGGEDGKCHEVRYENSDNIIIQQYNNNNNK